MQWDAYTLRVEVKAANGQLISSVSNFRVGPVIDGKSLEAQITDASGNEMTMEIKAAFEGETEERP